jgi:CheY-like chemotaxis protein
LQIQDIHLAENQETIPEGDYIEVIVSDTGKGIKATHIDHIFDPYFTTKEVGEGTGLGLSVVHGAIKGMGGEIRVESVPDRQTVFTFLLPVLERRAGEALQKYEDRELPSGDQEHILLVDDEVNITQVGKRMLEKLNYKVTAVNNSIDALAAFKEAPARFDLVITDMTMPEMTGKQLAEKIKQINPDLPVVLCTGFSNYLKEVSTDPTIDYSCKKPLSKEELAEVVNHAITSARH